jgi:hydrogenase maturation protease
VTTTRTAVTVIGVGNPFRCDDAVGPIVATRLMEHFDGDDRVHVADLDGEPVRLIQTWEGVDHVIVVDAVRSGAPVGTIHRYTVDHVTGRGLADDASPTSGHALGLGDAVDLALALGQLPADLVVLAVEGGVFDLGEGLSEAVAAACDALVTEIVDRVAGLLAASPPR